MRKIYSFALEISNISLTPIRNLFVVLLFVIISSGEFLSGQSSYTFSPSSGTFTAISGTTMALSGGTLDNGYFNSIPIGFSFNYWGNTYTSVSASTNGWLTFGQNISNSYYTNNLTSSGTRPLVAPLWDNHKMQAATDFSYTTTGSEGSRIFTAQWLNVKWDYNAVGSVISFQVKLYESSGMIEFIYRQESTAVNIGSASIGIAASSTGAGNFYSVQSTDPSTTVSSQTEVSNLNTRPATGQVFAFTPTLPQVEIASDDPAIAAGDILQNSLNNIIYSFNCSVTSSDANVTGLQITTSGSYSATDVDYLIAWYSEDDVFSESEDIIVSIKETSLGPGTHVFPDFQSQQIGVDMTGYFFITADVNCSAAQGNTISVVSLTTSDITIQSGTKTGTAYDGGEQTIQYAIPDNISGETAAPDATSVELSWTNPSGCFDEIMIVGKTSSITGSPSGDGSSYSANLAYGGGTMFDGGYILYKGTSSPQTVTSLLEGTTYYFKFFSRKGTNWSSGVEINSSTVAPLTGNFRSAATGNWSSTSTWEYYDGSWVPATSVPSQGSGTIAIRNGYTVTVDAAVAADQITVDAGGILSVATTITLTIADGTGTDCIVNGTLNNSGTITTTGTLSINNGGIYNHTQNGGAVPSATWATGSACRVTGATTTAPSNLNQSFYNFTWNCTQSQHISLGGYPANITGTFTLNSTGSSYRLSPGGNVTYANYIQTAGTFSILGAAATARTVNVTNFTLQGGTFNMSDAAAVGTLNVSGNFTHTAGTISESSSGSGSLNFNGSSMQTYTSGGSVSGMINFTVNPNAYLQMAAEGTVMPGTGASFTLSSSATLGITSSYGINFGTLGNIQTRTKNFNAAANYIYNGTGEQESGDGIIYTNLTGNVTIASSSAMKFIGDMIIDGSITVNGTLIPGEEYYVIDGTGTLNGTGTVQVNRTSETADFLSQYILAGKNLASLTIEYTSATGDQVVSPTTYSNLKLSNTSGTNSLGGNVTVSSTLTTTTGGALAVGSGQLLTAATANNAGILTVNPSGRATIGSLVNNGTLNLYSTGPSQNFSLMIDSYSGSGTADASMYLTGGGDPDYRWHYVAVPMNYANKNVFTSINSYNLLQYDQSLVSSDINEGWVWHDGWSEADQDYTGPSFSTLSVNRGYSFYHTADATVDFSDLTSLQTNLGSISLNYSGSDPSLHGFNLIGNSLTCGLDWNLVTESGDIDNTVYYIVDNKEAYYLRGVGGVNGGTKDIPPLQGFMVKSNATGTSLNFTNARQHTSQARYKKGGTDVESESDSKSSGSVSLVKLELNNLGNQDETIVWLGEQATASYEGDCDSRKFLTKGTYDQIFTRIGNTEIGINGIPLPAEKTVMPLSVILNNTGTSFKIIASSIQNLDDYKVILTDTYTNIETDLKITPEYSFSSATNGTFHDRFLLTITNLTTNTNDISLAPEPFKVFTYNKDLSIELLDNSWENKKGTVTLFNLQGNKVFIENKTEWAFGELKKYNLSLPSGLYIIEIKAENKRFVSKINLF